MQEDTGRLVPASFPWRMTAFNGGKVKVKRLFTVVTGVMRGWRTLVSLP